MESVSKFEQSQRTERLRRGRLSSVEGGGWKGGPPPFGYSIEDGRLVINDEESKWVIRIYEEYSKGKSIYEIRMLLMENGVLSRRGLVRWNELSVRNILKHTHYEGYYSYTDKKLEMTVKGVSPKILFDKDLVNRVRNRIQSNTYKQNNQKTFTLLKDFLVCGNCGSKLGQRINRKQYFQHYYCMGNQNVRKKMERNHPLICKSLDGSRSRSVVIDQTDELVWKTVVDVVSQSHLFKEIFKTDKLSVLEVHTLTDTEKRKIQNDVKKLEKDRQNILKVIEDKKVNSVKEIGYVDDNDDFLNRLIDEEKTTLSKIEQLNSQLYDNKRTTEWVDWVNDFRYKIEELNSDKMNVEDRKRFLSGVVDKVIVTTVDKQTHNIDVQFQTPMVGDGFSWKDKKNKKLGYEIYDGDMNIVVSMDTTDRRKKKLNT